MIFHNFSIWMGIVLALQTNHFPRALSNDANEESDDEKLKQALILVDILKAEYVKLLRENLQLRSGDINETVDVAEQSTCATTGHDAQAEAFSNSSTHTTYTTKEIKHELINAGQVPSLHQLPNRPNVKPADVPASYPEAPRENAQPDWPYSITPAPPQEPIQPFTHNIQNPHRFLIRRRMPDYYYHDIPQRRYYGGPPIYSNFRVNDFVPTGDRGFRRNFDNYDKFEHHSPSPALSTHIRSCNVERKTQRGPASQKSPFSDTTPPHGLKETTLSTLHKKQTLKGSQKISHVPRATPQNNKYMLRTTLAPPRRRQPDITTMAVKKETKDPVQSQVDTELEKELQEEGLTPIKPPFTKRSTTTEERWPAFTFGTSIKIHLGGSTRIPVPFPENNAFCYTNPNSPLCRTPV